MKEDIEAIAENKQPFENYPELADLLLHGATFWKTDGKWSPTLAEINKHCKELTDLKEGMQKLIGIMDKSVVRYKACFGEENPGGEQIYEYFAMQLKELLPTPPTT